MKVTTTCKECGHEYSVEFITKSAPNTNGEIHIGSKVRYYNLDQEGVVTSGNKKDGWKILWNKDGHTWGELFDYHDNELTLLEPSEKKNKFNVGDKVHTLREHMDYPGKECLGTVTNITEGVITVRWNNKNGAVFKYMANELVLA